MAVLFSESFTGASGALLSTTNTVFTFVQNGPTFSTDFARGTGSMRATYTASATAPLGEKTQTAATTGFYRFYVKLVTTGTLFYMFQTLSNTTVRAALSVDTTGGVRMRQGTTALGTAVSTAKLSTTAWTRVEFGITPTTVQLRMYQGANLHTSTATYDSGAVTWTSPGSWDRSRIGSVLTVAGIDLLLDEFSADNATWVGPAADTAPVTRSGTAGFTTSSTLVASGKSLKRGAASLPAKSTIAATGAAPRKGTASLTTTSTIAASGTRKQAGSSSLSSTSTLSASGSKRTAGSASISTTTALFASGKKSLSGSATATTATALSATGSKQASGNAALTTASIVAASGVKRTAGTAEVETQAMLEATGATDCTGSADLDSINEITADGTATHGGGAGIITTTALTSTGSIVRKGSTAYATTTSLQATGYVPSVNDQSGAAFLSTRATLAASGFRSPIGEATLVSKATLAVTGSRTTQGAAELVTRVTLTALSFGVKAGTAELRTVTTLTADGSQSAPGRNIDVTANIGPRSTTAVLERRAHEATIGQGILSARIADNRTQATLRPRAWEGTL